VTRHPTAEWLARQITEAFPWLSAPDYLVRDNDGVYGHVFTRQVRAMGIRDRPISPGSPWQNGYAERLIGSVRRECLDQMLIFGGDSMQRIVIALPVSLVTFAAFAELTNNMAARTDLHAIDTLTLSDAQYGSGDANAKTTATTGALRIPRGNGRLPVVTASINEPVMLGLVEVNVFADETAVVVIPEAKKAMVLAKANKIHRSEHANRATFGGRA
jgi:transposase InsO family protein